MRILNFRFDKSQSILLALTFFAYIRRCFAAPYNSLPAPSPEHEFSRRQDVIDTTDFVFKGWSGQTPWADLQNNTVETTVDTGEKLECYRMREDSKRGPMLVDLHNWLESPANKYNRMPYIIDQAGCFQVSCIGERGKISLCNNHPPPSYMVYEASAIWDGVKYLTHWFRTLEENLYWVQLDPGGYPDDYWRVFVPFGKCSEKWADNAEKTMQDRVWGAFTTPSGATIQIDQPPGEAACNASKNFVPGDCQWTSPQTCSWPYDTEIPIVYN
ncbi:hypothetical protein ABW21_db0201432 [Orbilia brochopaga]|nr:hypothetical protein ABW21_db0201432 [Drechslerella brochopaga]